MMCPNKNHPDWKALEATYGSTQAFRYWMAGLDSQSKVDNYIKSKVAETPIKEGVSELFDSNPELASIGTQQQYSQYLDTIFPDSKVKDIVYRGSEKGIEKELNPWLYFSDSKADANMYAKAHISKGGKATERNPIPVIKSNIGKKYNLNKDVLWAITDDQKGVDGLEREGFISKEDATKARDLLLNNKDVQNLKRLIELYPIVKIESELDLMKQFDDEQFILNKPEYDRIRKELEPFFDREQVGKLETVILNIKNPLDGGSWEDLVDNREAYKNNHDGAILLSGEHFMIKNKLRQVHILGSQKDMLGFKKFVGEVTETKIKPGVEELFESNSELANAVYEVLGFNQLITPKDRIVFGHPTIGKSFLKNQGEDKFISLDDDYATEINNKVKEIADKYNVTTYQVKDGGTQKWNNEYNQMMQKMFNVAKQRAISENKTLFTSNTNLLKNNAESFDKVINLTDKEFERRIQERGTKYDTKEWKSQINDTISKFPISKVINTDKYLSDLFITPQQKQQALQLYSQYLDTIFPNSKVKDIKGFKEFVSEDTTQPEVEDPTKYKKIYKGSELTKPTNPNNEMSLEGFKEGQKGVYEVFEENRELLEQNGITAEMLVKSISRNKNSILDIENWINNCLRGRAPRSTGDTLSFTPKAEQGMKSSKFTKGGTWKIIKDLQGYPTHEKGGVDLMIGKDGVNVTKGESNFKAEYGLVLPKAQLGQLLNSVASNNNQNLDDYV